MAKSVNKVILLGNVGKDPEIKYTPNGTAVATFSIATGERFKDKQGEFQERTEWHNIVAWDKLAEIISNYVKKGNKLYLEGRIQTRSWDDKQTGEKKYKTEIVASDISLLGGKSDGGGSGEEGGYNQRSSGGYSRNPGPQSQSQPQSSRSDDYAADTQISDDDIPF